MCIRSILAKYTIYLGYIILVNMCACHPNSKISRTKIGHEIIKILKWFEVCFYFEPFTQKGYLVVYYGIQYVL